MSITYQNSGSFRIVNPNDSTTFNVGTGDNRYLLVNTNHDTTQVAYGGVNMTKIYTFTDPISDGNGNNIYVWGLANPTSGSNTLQFTNTPVDGIVSFACYNGVSEGTQPEASNSAYSNNGTNNTQVVSLSTSLTTVNGGAWVILLPRGGNNAPRDFTSSDGTVRTTLGTTDCAGVIDTDGGITPPAIQTLTTAWSSGTGFISLAIIALTPTPESIIQTQVL